MQNAKKDSNNSNNNSSLMIPQTTGCMIGEYPSDKVLNLPAINNFSEGTGLDETRGQSGGPNPNTTKTYRLLREKVPIDPIDSWSVENNEPDTNLLPYYRSDGSNRHFIKYIRQTINGVNFEIYYPNQWGESTLDHVFASKYENPGTELRYHQEGILFFLRLKTDGVPETVVATDRRSGQKKDFWLVDVYQEESRFQASLTGARGYTYEDVFKCQGNAPPTQIIYPGSDSGDKNQLQLRSFIIKSDVSNSIGFSAHCKPAIYLYPEKTTDVNVKVETKGALTYTDPLYPASSGWNVVAYPGGRIVYQGKDYPYLYYESKIPDDLIDKPKEGFVVLYNDLPELLSDVLPKLGLSNGQTADFKEYWERILPVAPYYFVGILSEENINSFEPLSINPKPLTTIRVRLYFEALENKIEVKEPKITSPKRNGFTVVEWGGMIKTDKNHPFTCSQ